MKKIKGPHSSLILIPLGSRPMSTWHILFISSFGRLFCIMIHPGHIEYRQAHTVIQLNKELQIPDISNLLAWFLFEQLWKDDNESDALETHEYNYWYKGKIKVFNSATTLFYTPSDVSGIHGMWQEIIRSTPLWRNEGPCYDCAFMNANLEMESINGLEVVHILAFFSFHFRGSYYPCAVVHWFNRIGDKPDEDTGMWLVCPQFNQQHQCGISIVHIDTIYHAAHLIPMYGKHLVPSNLQPHHSYNRFQLFYVNKFADHHIFEIAS